MSSSYSYVALLDILGYRAHLQRDQQEGTDSFRKKLQRALGYLASINESDVQHQAISDTVILASSNRADFDNFCSVVRRFFVGCLDSGLFCRGGIAFGQHFKSAQVTYSRALSRAHELEDGQAIFPRIVVDKNIVTMVKQEGLRLSHGQLATQNGTWFLNPARSPAEWRDLFGACKRMYEEEESSLEGSEGAFSKHAWIHNFLWNHPARPNDVERFLPEFNVWPPASG